MITARQAPAAWVSRNEVFVGLVTIGFVNGISDRVSSAVADSGAAAAVANTFNISVIVWVAWASSLAFLLHGNAQPIRRLDWLVATVTLLAILVPFAALSWLALVGLAVHILRTSPLSGPLRRAAWILLALTVPMYWARQLFTLLSDVILQADAMMVSWLVGTSRLGNTIEFADGSGSLWIAPACSSWANMSLAVLCWVTVTQGVGHRNSLRDIGWIVLACVAVVAINVTRLSLMGLYPKNFDLIHGPVGATAANVLSLGAIVAICLFAVRRDLPIGVDAKLCVTFQPGLSATFSLVLGVSVFLKVSGLASPALGAAARPVFPGEIAMLLEQQGFYVRQETPTDDLGWVSGTEGNCEVVVTEVSPHGWHRSLVTQLARGHHLAYLFDGGNYPEQPLMRTRVDYYWSRLNSYLGREVPSHPVLAVISTSTCEDLPLRELADLSDR